MSAYRVLSCWRSRCVTYRSWLQYIFGCVVLHSLKSCSFAPNALFLRRRLGTADGQQALNTHPSSPLLVRLPPRSPSRRGYQQSVQQQRPVSYGRSGYSDTGHSATSSHKSSVSVPIWITHIRVFTKNSRVYERRFRSGRSRVVTEEETLRRPCLWIPVEDRVFLGRKVRGKWRWVRDLEIDLDLMSRIWIERWVISDVSGFIVATTTYNL